MSDSKNWRRSGKALAFLGTLLSAAPALAAGGVAIDGRSLPAGEVQTLERDIRAYKATNPGAFDALRTVRGCSEAGYRVARNPVPNCSRELRRLGPGVLLPMLEALALREPTGLATSEAEKRALGHALLQAIGIARDTRALPWVEAVLLRGVRRDAATLGFAGEAIGRIGTDAAVALLIRHSVAGDPLRLAAIAGLGQVRALPTAQHLVGLATQQQPTEVLRAIARSLGVMGSSWAWRAMGPKAHSLGLQVRAEAAGALALLFVLHGGEIREEAGKGLLMTELPGTRAMLTNMRSLTDADGAKAIDKFLSDYKRLLPPDAP